MAAQRSTMQSRWDAVCERKWRNESAEMEFDFYFISPHSRDADGEHRARCSRSDPINSFIWRRARARIRRWTSGTRVRRQTHCDNNDDNSVTKAVGIRQPAADISDGTTCVVVRTKLRKQKLKMPPIRAKKDVFLYLSLSLPRPRGWHFAGENWFAQSASIVRHANFIWERASAGVRYVCVSAFCNMHAIHPNCPATKNSPCILYISLDGLMRSHILMNAHFQRKNEKEKLCKKV